MSGFVGVVVSDPWLQSQFTQVELRGLNSKVSVLKNHSVLISFDINLCTFFLSGYLLCILFLIFDSSFFWLDGIS